MERKETDTARTHVHARAVAVSIMRSIYLMHFPSAKLYRGTVIFAESRENILRARKIQRPQWKEEGERKRRERGVSGIESARSGGACAINDEADKTRDKQNSILRSKTFVKFINCNIAAGSPSALLGTSLSKTNRKSMDR